MDILLDTPSPSSFFEIQNRNRKKGQVWKVYKYKSALKIFRLKNFLQQLSRHNGTVTSCQVKPITEVSDLSEIIKTLFWMARYH